MSDATTPTSENGPQTGAGRKPLTHWIMAAFGAPGLPLALVGLPMAVYLPAVYAGRDGYGLSLATVGVVLMLTRFGDVITDPVIGFISDRTRTRWGRRKPYVLIGTPIFALGIWLLFLRPMEFEEVTWLGMTFNTGYPYLFFTLSLVYLGSTIKDLPYRAWGAELSANYNERTSITSWREAFGTAGSLVSAFTPAIIFFLGYTRPIDAVFFLSVAMLIVMPILVLNLLIVVPEFPVRERVQERIPLIQGLALVLQNKVYLRYILIFTVGGIGQNMTNALSFFFVEHVLVAGALYGFYLAPYFISQIAAIPLWLKLSTKIGKHRATMATIIWYSFWACGIPIIAWAPNEWFSVFQIHNLLAFLPQSWYDTIVAQFEGIETGKFLFFIIVMCLKGSAMGGLSALTQSMAADIIDVDTRTSGQQRAGAYFAISGLIGKSAAALGVFLGTSLAVWGGFDQLADPENTTNTAATLIWVACLYSVVPALFKIISMPFLWTWPISEKSLADIQQEIYSPAEGKDEAEEQTEEGKDAADEGSFEA
ncbi:MAG: MFS transporter [Pseudomonadales bacterium]|nr:MFS transporter [Pseudomonadales bacterium]MDP7596898.1 MFS transporter [Pseudomonadales bacterium]HJN51723.1 MFS transporter [Pseudomonadales bacterium]|tara:strand:- start:425 stop:2035 length:1611 start_codon:yes stop_codon:yes gene_type:complete